MTSCWKVIRSDQHRKELQRCAGVSEEGGASDKIKISLGHSELGHKFDILAFIRKKHGQIVGPKTKSASGTRLKFDRTGRRMVRRRAALAEP